MAAGCGDLVWAYSTNDHTNDVCILLGCFAKYFGSPKRSTDLQCLFVPPNCQSDDSMEQGGSIS